ncbi:hypothetical protein [Candidatus Binatus sp.]|uniref:hypothetical protein n=1 Tax=Candidatus Binatus sp. TaxID=2811406 RepID=UPI003BAFAECD
MGASEKRSDRSGYYLASFLQVVIIAFVLTLAGRAAAFTQIFPPFTGASDFITGFPTCPDVFDTIETEGPIGLLFDGAYFFVDDPCNGTTYRFAADGGSASTPDALVANGLITGLTLKGGVYYGNGSTSPVFDPTTSGLYKFDPTTLSTTLVANLPVVPFGLAGQPGTTNLWVGDLIGLYAVANPDSGSPSVIDVTNAACFDGISFTDDGTRFYSAVCGTTLVFAYDFTTSTSFTVDTTHPAMACDASETDCTDQGTDGTAVALSNTTLSGINVSNNVFVNSHDGTLVRIDVNNGNAVSVVASGGSRGDFVTVGPDNCLYVTQSDRIEKMSPCFFQVSIANKCPLAQGTWKNTPTSAWPVTSLVLGSQSYTPSQLQTILKTPTRGDASLILADQLIAAKLSIAGDSNPGPIASTISSADSLLSAQPGRLPYHIKPSSATGQAMVNDGDILNSYDSDALTTSCTP